MAEIVMKRDLRAANAEYAEKLRQRFAENRVLVVNVMGSPGSGKTTLLENLLPAPAKQFRTAVIEGDLATDNDARRMREAGIEAVQINTNGACHLDASMITNALGGLELASLDLLIIENVGNLVCPVFFSLGEDYRIVVISTAEGEDKPVKYPDSVLKADAVVISKTDIAGYVGASVAVMKKYISDINPKAEIFETGIYGGKYALGGLDGRLTSLVRKKISD